MAAYYTPVTPTKKSADEAHLISTHDVDAFEIFCREQKIEAITFGASESNITYGRQLVKRLGLPLIVKVTQHGKLGVISDSLKTCVKR